MIGIVGGSGDFGQGLTQRLRALGEEVVIGSRTPRGDFVSNPDACAGSDMIFLSVPPSGVEPTARELASVLAGKVVVSVASSLSLLDGASLAERAAAAAPAARVVAGFHTVSAKLLAQPDHALDEDVLLCGEEQDAKDAVAAIAQRLVAGRAVDCGDLSVARRLEALTGLLVGVNRRYRTNAGIRVTGLG